MLDIIKMSAKIVMITSVLFLIPISLLLGLDFYIYVITRALLVEAFLFYGMYEIAYMAKYVRNKNLTHFTSEEKEEK